MATSNAQAAMLFVERMRAALPGAIGDAFGGAPGVASVDAGALPDLLAELGEGHHVHLELEANVGRLRSRVLLLVLRHVDATALFGLEPADEPTLSAPEVQLRLLAEYTEGAEALASALAGQLTPQVGAPVVLRVSGASLEEAEISPTATSALGDGDVVGFSLMLSGIGGGVVPVVVGAAADLAATLGSEAGEAAPAAPTPVNIAERAAPRAPEAAPAFRAPSAAPAAPAAFAPPAPQPAGPPKVAHPFAFGQLDAGMGGGSAAGNIDPILDVALQVRVELGSTEMTVEKVLALGVGSVVELDKLAGEPVDIVVNNRLIARGEVVVVEENFGVRVTEIVAQRHRATG
jgi:flagellar motor switch protein FliN